MYEKKPLFHCLSTTRSKNIVTKEKKWERSEKREEKKIVICVEWKTLFTAFIVGHSPKRTVTLKISIPEDRERQSI